MSLGRAGGGNRIEAGLDLEGEPADRDETWRFVDASGTPLPRDEYFVPGSILETSVDASNPAAFGIGDRVDMMFNRSPVLKLDPGAEARGVRRLAWYDSDTPLRSGWAWGQEHLRNGLAAIEADVGEGKLFIFAPEVVYRGQPHKTFKFVFNAIYLATAKRPAPTT